MGHTKLNTALRNVKPKPARQPLHKLVPSPGVLGNVNNQKVYSCGSSSLYKIMGKKKLAKFYGIFLQKSIQRADIIPFAKEIADSLVQYWERYVSPARRCQIPVNVDPFPRHPP
jgi:hypothetical protein